MITRIELDGFKTFRRFSLDLAPLQVIVGPNGAGKSNLFDALQLLGRLAESDLRSAFQNMRGEAGELFTIPPDGEPVTEMRLAVELLVERTVQDDWGAEEALRYPRLRYELEILRVSNGTGLEPGLPQVRVTHESLALIPRSEDRWTERYDLSTAGAWIPRMTGGRPSPFISTSVVENGKQDQLFLRLHQDHGSGHRRVKARQAERTILSGVRSTEFPHAFAVAEEMRRWRFLHINAAELRQPSPMTGPDRVDVDGRHLANVLARMKARNPDSLAAVIRDLSDLVPGIKHIDVETDSARNQYILWATMEDGRRFSSRVLSDGTLRILTLITLKHDPMHAGVLCLEEPENGIHPFRLGRMAHLLQELATDFGRPNASEAPLRQVLANTHSPVFISYQDILPHVLFTYSARSRGSTWPVTRIVPVQPDPMQPTLFQVPIEERTYTLSEIQAYLETGDIETARRTLIQGRDTTPPAPQ